VHILGSPGLVRLHLRVAQQLGVPVVTIDARDAQLAAWAALANARRNEA